MSTPFAIAVDARLMTGTLVVTLTYDWHSGGYPDL